MEIPFILYVPGHLLLPECWLLRATDILPLRARYHSIRLSERIPMSASPTLADACMVRYPSFESTDSYRHATAASHIPFDSPQRADSNGVLPDSIRLLVVEIAFILYVPGHFLLPECWLMRATDMLLLRVIYHSIRLSERIPMRASPTLADACLVRYPSFSFTNSYRHATAANLIPFKPSQRADSNECFPDPGGRLPGTLPFF